MLKNYFKIAARNLLKNKLHTGINLIGLSLGLGVAIIIFFFVQFEMTYDTFHTEGEKVFRLKRAELVEGVMEESFSTPVITASTFEDEFPQITHVSPVIGGTARAYLTDETVQDQNILMVSPDFLKLFGFELLAGDVSKVLQEKYSVVVTEDAARKYFGESDPMGKSIRMKLGDEFESYQVTGLLKRIPGNSSIRFEVLVNDKNLDYIIAEDSQSSWFQVYGETYVKLQDAQQRYEIEAGVEAMMRKVLGEKYIPGAYTFSLNPILDMHLADGVQNGMIEATNPALLWILAGIAFLILLIASINFTTMAIGQATTRAKEVGVRKTMGADFRQLIGQFLMEAFLTTVSALVFGLIIAEVMTPVFNDLFQKELVLQYQPVQLMILVGLVVFITLLAGAYPAFFMSNLRPLQVLKGSLSIHFGKQGLRKGLVGFQFFVSFLLIASTLIMVNQMKAIRSYDLGFDQDMIVMVNIPEVSAQSFVTSINEGFKNADLYRQALERRTEVKSAGITIATYGDDAFWKAGFPLEDGRQFNFRVNFVGGDYTGTLGLDLAKGRDFNPSPGADSTSFLINETFARAMGWDDPLAEIFPGPRFHPHQIVGVVKDFHHSSLYQEIEPVVLAKSPQSLFSGINSLNINSSSNPKVMVKGAGTDFGAFKAALEEEWRRLYPLEAFSFSFMDETVEAEYLADERLGKMVFLAAGIAILIAAMGLFALAALSIAGRTKEIGIRKVLGASSWSISWMFNKEFLLITLIGVLVAMPLSRYLMQGWIQQFAVKEWPSWMSFLTLTIAGIVFTLFIVFAQSYRATQMNPVKTLKDE